MIVVVLESVAAQVSQALTVYCDPKMKFDILTIPDDADWGTADSLRHIKDKIEVMFLYNIWTMSSCTVYLLEKVPPLLNKFLELLICCLFDGGVYSSAVRVQSYKRNDSS